MEHINLIKHGIKSAFGVDQWDDVEALTRGLSASSISKLRIGENYYVAKVSDLNNPENNLVREYHAQIIGAKHKVAPAVYYSDPNAGIIIMDYIETRPISTVERNKLAMITKFANFVQRVHACDAFQADQSIFRKLEIIHSMLSEDFQQAEQIKSAMQIKADVEQYLNDEADLRPCHNDINPYNLLYDGNKFWLVDWAAAAQENFYFDLAACVMFFYLQNDSSIEAFLQAYFGRALSQAEKDKFYFMQTFVYIYYGIMFVFASNKQQVALLSQEEIDNLPNYAEFMEAIGAGKINLGDGKSQQQLGFIYLEMAVS